MSAFNSTLALIFERNQEATLFVGNLDPQVNEEILWELFTQCGPVQKIYLPKDKVSQTHNGFAFVELRTMEDADYAIKILHMMKLFNNPIKVNKLTQDKRVQEVGANLFVGNLSEDINEKSLKDIFSSFGVVLSTKIMRDPESGISRHYGFVSFDNFDSSDNAILKLNGQYIKGRPIEVTYAYKKDTKNEKHGNIAERILAKNRPISMIEENMPVINENNASDRRIGEIISDIHQDIKQNTGMTFIDRVRPPSMPPNVNK